MKLNAIRAFFYICHEKSPDAVHGLLDGTVDLVISNPVKILVQTATRAMAEVLTGKRPVAAEGAIEFQLVTAENI